MLQTSLTELLRLTSDPVAITFVDAAPPGVPHVSAVEPAGCGYWRRAAAGEVFFTVADDHKRCGTSSILRPTSPSLAYNSAPSREKLAVRANQELEKLHRGRAAASPPA